VQFTFYNFTPSSVSTLEISQTIVCYINVRLLLLLLIKSWNYQKLPLRLRQHWFWKSLVWSWCFRKSNSSTFM